MESNTVIDNSFADADFKNNMVNICIGDECSRSGGLVGLIQGGMNIVDRAKVIPGTFTGGNNPFWIFNSNTYDESFVDPTDIQVKIPTTSWLKSKCSTGNCGTYTFESSECVGVISKNQVNQVNNNSTYSQSFSGCSQFSDVDSFYSAVGTSPLKAWKDNWVNDLIYVINPNCAPGTCKPPELRWISELPQ